MALAVALSIGASGPVSANVPDNAAALLNDLNLALKNDPLNAQLHFRTALAYETSSVAGSERREVSKAGYAMALKADPAFWPAHVQLGLMALEEKDPIRAQQHLLDAAILNSSEPVVYYALARAAYCNGELGLAQAVYARAVALRVPSSVDELTTGAAIRARGGESQAAQSLVQEIALAGAVPHAMVTRAVQDGAAPVITQKPEALNAAPIPVTINSKMGMVDIIILRRDEARQSTSGINLLEVLKLQLGGSLLNSRWTSSRDRLTGSLSSSMQDITREITATLPSVTYSLNIANARDGWSTIQAQQALLIYDQQASKVSVGSSLTYATDGDLNSSVATKDAGLSLEIKPEFMAQGIVKVTVSAILEEFVESAAGSFRQSVQTEKSTTDVTAELRFGETILIASGESTTNSRAGNKTPLLSDVPVLGQLFQNKRTSKANTSLLILLTLRARGSEQVPHADEVEREMFRLRKDRLLEQLNVDDESFLHQFIPDPDSMSYKLGNPARSGDKSYLGRAGALPAVVRP
jgi:hypothetical protein